MNTLGIIFVLIICLTVIALLWGIIRTYTMEHSEMQQRFMRGGVDSSSLDGDFIGVAHGYEKTSWQGKTLRGAEATGINRFLKDGVTSSKYPFKFFIRKGLRDTNQDVIVLDYNQPGNPWWLTYIVDEIVEVAPEEFLGKVHVQLAPKIIFTLGYFTLSK